MKSLVLDERSGPLFKTTLSRQWQQKIKKNEVLLSTGFLPRYPSKCEATRFPARLSLSSSHCIADDIKV